jgi:hypothetical protein
MLSWSKRSNSALEGDEADRGDSKRSVANSAGVSRRTVGRIENRREVYESQDRGQSVERTGTQ